MESLCYLLAQPYTLTAQTLVVDDAVGSPRNVVLPAGVYRALLASSTGTGTTADPYELLGTLRAQLGLASWDVEMLPTGRVRVTYLDTGTGKITLTLAVRSLLGNAGSTAIGPLATGASLTFDRQPTHCVFAAAAEDEGWQSMQGRAAVQEMPDGSVYGWQDARTRLTRRITLTMLPRDDAARTTLGSLSTPAIASTTYRLDPGAGAPGQAPPWSVPQTLATAVGDRCGWTDDLQAIIAGTATAFDAVYLGAESHTAPTSLSIPGYDPRRSIGPMMLSWAATESV
jgi:hypothetical protein